MDTYGYTKNTSVEDRVWQWGTGIKQTIGAKRNELIKYSRADIIAHLDSDDYYHPNWISHSVNQLLNTNADMTGLSSAVFRRLSNNQCYQYIYQTGQPYVLGATQCYWRKTWERAPFPDKQTGEDASFCASAGRVLPHGFISGFEASIHPKNTDKRYTNDTRAWKPLGVRPLPAY